MQNHRSTSRRRLSRRRFMSLAAAAAGAAAMPTLSLAAQTKQPAPARGKSAARKTEATAPAKPAAPAFTAAERKEIARLAAQVEDALKKIRAGELPTGSEPATRFAVLRSVRGRR